MPRAEQVVVRVSRYFEIPVAVLFGPSRVRSVTYARHIAMWLLRQQGLGYKRTAEALGRSDRDTARYAVHRIEAELRAGTVETVHDIAELSEEA